MAEPVFMKLGMYVIAPETISTAYFLNLSDQSLCLFVYPLIVARQRLGKKTLLRNECTGNSIRIIGLVVFYAIRVSEGK
jgi:hypothetical protein